MNFSDLVPNLVTEPNPAVSEADARQAVDRPFPTPALHLPVVNQDLLLQWVALMAARELWSREELEAEYGEAVASLLSDQTPGEDDGKQEAYQLMGASQMLNRGTETVTVQVDGSYLSEVGERMWQEKECLYQEIQNNLLLHLGSVIRFGLYHRRSRTFIPWVCERGIIVSINDAHFADDRLLVSQALALLAAYNERAGELGLPVLSKVGFYNHRVDGLLGDAVHSSCIVDASRIDLP